MDISVIIPTYNRYTCLHETCRYLSAQQECSFEVVIIDQTPIDCRQALKTRGKNIRYFIQELPSASAARNLGLSHAYGEVVLFLDDDVIIEDQHFLSKHWRHYADSSIVGVAGGAPDVGQSASLKTHRFFRTTGLGWMYFSNNYSCQTWLRVGRSNNLSVRRELALQIGGMDEQFERGAHREEADFGIRFTSQHGPFLYDPLASLVHIGNSSGGIRSWQKQSTVKAKHHMIGDIYLLCRHIPWRSWPEYLVLSLFYFVFPHKIKTSPAHYIPAAIRYLSAWLEVQRKIAEGPKFITKNHLNENPCL